jgi:hypothetical protein
MLMHFSFKVFSPKDVLLGKGEPADCLYFIYQGAVGVYDDSELKYGKVEGDVIGTGSIYFIAPSLYDYEASEFVRVAMLQIATLNLLLDRFPEMKQILVEERTRISLITKSPEELDAPTIESQAREAYERVLAGSQAAAAGIFQPTAPFCRVWNMVSLFFLFYFYFAVPARISLGYFMWNSDWQIKGTYISSSIFMDLVVDVFFLVDIYMRVKHFGVVDEGVLEMRRPRIRQLYVEKRLLWDLFAVCPLDYFLLFHSVQAL